jgi:hypothetical protein
LYRPSFGYLLALVDRRPNSDEGFSLQLLKDRSDLAGVEAGRQAAGAPGASLLS